MLFKNISLLDEELNIKENMNLFVNEAEGIIEKIFLWKALPILNHS